LVRVASRSKRNSIVAEGVGWRIETKKYGFLGGGVGAAEMLK
jgi:hypothetical protein